MISKKIAIKQIDPGLYTIIYKIRGKPLMKARFRYTYKEVRKYVLNWEANEDPEWKNRFEDIGYIKDIARIPFG